MNAKKKEHRAPSQRVLPFIGLFGEEGAERNVRMALDDPKTPPALRAELERYLKNPARAAAADQQKLVDAAEQHAAPFRVGRTSGVDRDDEKQRRDRIRELGMKHPTLSSRELYRHIDARSIREDGITTKRFANILSEEAPRRSKRTV